MTARRQVAGFRLRLLLAMMVVVCAVTALALWLAQRQVAVDAEHELRQAFQSEIASLHRAREIRHAALMERSRSLVRRPRIHAALEDNALDLLYPSAEDELRDVMQGDDAGDYPLHARFYRFLDEKGAVIPAPPNGNAGVLSAHAEQQIGLSSAPSGLEVGYFELDGIVTEIIAAPIISTETNEVIASILLGFKPFEVGAQYFGLKHGIFTHGRLYLPAVPVEVRDQLAALPLDGGSFHSEVLIEGAPYLVFSQLLNPASLFPAAYELCVYPLAMAEERSRQVRWQILGGGLLMLLGAGAASLVISARLSKPVEQLAVDSAHNESKREQAEAALEQTSEELQRWMRFSADASHQLKTPVTVLRAGLEELQQHRGFNTEAREDVATLIHQTFRLTTMIEDLLLLSRMDAGCLRITYQKVDLSELIAALVDDITARPDADDLTVETEVPDGLTTFGERRYTSMIVQNLLDNACKYNRPGGKIRITATVVRESVLVVVGNTGAAIPVNAQQPIFERFHRGSSGENVPGHGLGLNLARELARSHGGDLRLVDSQHDWTEFEIRLCAATASSMPP